MRRQRIPQKKSPSKPTLRKKARKTGADDVPPRQPFLKCLLSGGEKPDLAELESDSTIILDILSPTTVDTESRDYIVVDGAPHAYLCITGYGYSTTVDSCWLAPLVEAGEGVSVSFMFRRQPRDKVFSRIVQTIMINRSRMRDVGDTRQDYGELDSAISSGLYLKDMMNRQGEDFYCMDILIEVTTDDPETLEQWVTAAEKLCAVSDMIARCCDCKQEQVSLSTLSLLLLDPDVEHRSRRSALTSGVTAVSPFAFYELSDRNGIFLGLNLYNCSSVFLGSYDDYKYTNGNLRIGGTFGVGKSITLRCLGDRTRQQGRRVIFIVSKKGYEFRPLCEKIGGLYLRLSSSSEDCLSLMAIRRKTLDSHVHLHNLKKRGDSVLAAKISSLLIWYFLQKKDMSDEDRNYLDISLMECYRRYGTTFENDSLVDENGDFKEMPILEDRYNVLQENAETRHLAVVLIRYVTGSTIAMGKRNHIGLSNKYVVLNTTGMPADLMLPGIFWVTEVVSDIIMDFGTEQFALLADELWVPAGATSSSHVAGFVLEMAKTIRGLSGIVVTSTQGMQDLLGLEGGKYGKGILDSSRLKTVMQMEEQEARLIRGVFNLSEDKVRQITRFRRGEGLLCFGYNHVPIPIYVTPKEYEAIATSPTDRQATLEGRQADG